MKSAAAIVLTLAAGAAVGIAFGFWYGSKKTLEGLIGKPGVPVPDGDLAARQSDPAPGDPNYSPADIAPPVAPTNNYGPVIRAWFAPGSIKQPYSTPVE